MDDQDYFLNLITKTIMDETLAFKQEMSGFKLVAMDETSICFTVLRNNKRIQYIIQIAGGFEVEKKI